MKSKKKTTTVSIQEKNKTGRDQFQACYNLVAVDKIVDKKF
jgi:hypothetical protein